MPRGGFNNGRFKAERLQNLSEKLNFAQEKLVEASGSFVAPQPSFDTAKLAVDKIIRAVDADQGKEPRSLVEKIPPSLVQAVPW